MSKDKEKTREELLKEIEALKLKSAAAEVVKRQFSWVVERLKDEKETVQLYLDTAGVIMLALNSEGKVTMINKKGSQLVGYPQEEIIGTSWIDRFVPENIRQSIKDLFFGVISGEIDPTPFEYYESPLLTRKGERRTILWHSAQVKDKKGKVIATLSSGEDVTERNNAEEARLQNLEFYRSLIKASPDAIVLFSLDSNIIMINQQAANLFSFEHKEEAIGRNILDFVTKDDGHLIQADLQILIKEGKLKAAEYNLVKSDGSTFLGEINSSVIKDAYGKDKALMTVVRGVTKRKETEEIIRDNLVRDRTMEVLKDSRDYLDKIINSVADPIFVKDREHRWVLLNDACCEFMGYKRQELIGKSDYDYFPKREADIFWNRDEIVFGTGKGNINEEEFTDSKGVEHTIITKKTLYVDSEGEQYIVGIIRDITEQKRVEKERLKRQELEGELREQEKIQQALQDSEVQHRLTFESMADAIHVIDKDMKVILMNTRFKQWTKELNLDSNIVGKNILKAFPFLGKNMGKEYKEVFESGEVLITEERNTIFKQEIVTETRKIPIFKEGAVFQIVTIVRDITERKKAEEAIKSLIKGSSKRGEKFFDSMVSQLAKTFEADYALIGQLSGEDSDKIRTIAFYAEGKIGKNFEYDLLHTPCSKLLREKICSYQSGVADKFPKDTILKEMNIQGYVGIPLCDSQGKVIGIVVGLFKKPISDTQFTESILTVFASRIASEIERSRAEDKLSLTQFSVDSAANAIFWIDEKARFSYVNDEACRSLGYSRKELLSLTVHDIDPNYTKKFWPKHWQDIRKRKSLTIETLHKTKDGKVFPVEILAHYLKFKGKEYNCAFARDISERKQASQALEKSEQRLRAIFESAKNVSFIITDASDPDPKIIEFSPGAEVIFGFTRNEVIGKGVSILHIPEDVSRIPKIHEKMRQGKRGFRGGATLVRKSGEKFPAMFSTYPLLDSEGGMYAALGISIDISERKKTERALLFTQFVIDHMGDAAIWITSQGKFAYVNEAACKTLGYSREELLSKTIHDVDVNFPKELWLSEWQEAKRKKTTTIETHFKGKDKKIFPVEISGNYMSYEDTEYLCAIVRDTTDRERIEQALRRSEQDKTMILDTLSELVVYYDTKLRIVWANKAAVDLTGISFHDLIGRHCYDVWPGRKKVCNGCPVKQALKIKSAQEGEVYSSDGHCWYIRGYPVLNEQGKLTGAVEVSLDITQQKKAEEESKSNLDRSYRILEETIQALAATAERRDPYTAGHQRRVSQLACAIAKELDLDAEQIEGIRLSSIIHDVGKVYVPAEILNKPISLSDLEFDIIKTHSQIGYEILAQVEFPWPVAQAVLQHHERIDGSGYPNGISGNDIIIEAKVIIVADVVEAMASHRPYRAAIGVNKALEEITSNKGTFYEPKIVDACVKLFKKKNFKFD